MIQSQEEFDALLEEATVLMDHDHTDGSPQSRRLSDVMGLLAEYSSFMEAAPEEDPGAGERAELLARADELERRFNRTNGHQFFPDLHGPGHAV